MVTDIQILDRIDQHVANFLLPNGFEQKGIRVYQNDRCTVTVNNTGYEVQDKDGGSIFSRDHVIYWLVGLLFWNGYIDRKNFKIP